MKKLLFVVLIWILVFNSVYAEQATFLGMVTEAGINAQEIVADGEMFTQETVDNLTSHGSIIVFADNSYFQMVLWSEEGTPYGFSVINFDGSADMNQARELFVQALENYEWEACSYSKQADDGSSIELVYTPGFDDESEGEHFEILDDFLGAVKNEYQK